MEEIRYFDVVLKLSGLYKDKIERKVHEKNKLIVC